MQNNEIHSHFHTKCDKTTSKRTNKKKNVTLNSSVNDLRDDDADFLRENERVHESYTYKIIPEKRL